MIFAIPLMFGRVVITLIFPILTTLSISSILLLTFAGFGILSAWAFYKREYKRIIFPGLFLVLPAFIALILKLLYPILDFYFELLALYPFSALMLAIFSGFGSIIISSSYRHDFGKVLRLIWLVFLAITLSTLLWIPLYLVPPLLNLPLPRIITISSAALITVVCYLLGRHSKLFLKILGPVSLIELLSFVAVNLITL